MEVIKINKENLEYIRKMTEDFKTEFPYPVYIDYGKSGSIVVLIMYGKYIDYFTHVDVIFPENIIKQNLKMIVKFNHSDINAENIVNADIFPSIDIHTLIKTIFKNRN